MASESIAAILIFVLAGILMVLSILHFMEKGFLMNNAYLYASKEEKKTMNKKPYYRQSGIVFFTLSLLFIVIGLSVVLHNNTLLLLEIPLIGFALIYSIISSIFIEKHKKKNISGR